MITVVDKPTWSKFLHQLGDTALAGDVDATEFHTFRRLSERDGRSSQ